MLENCSASDAMPLTKQPIFFAGLTVIVMLALAAPQLWCRTTRLGRNTGNLPFEGIRGR